MPSYRCKCGHWDDEQTKCPKCNVLLEPEVEKPAKKTKKKK